MIIEIHACGSGLYARPRLSFYERVFMMDFITLFNFVLEYVLRNGPERKSVNTKKFEFEGNFCLSACKPKYSKIWLIQGRGRPRRVPPPYGPKYFLNFVQFLEKLHVGAFPWRVGAPFYGESWIRPCPRLRN